MKLRNKKTGEVVDVESLGHAASLKEEYGYQVTLSWKTEYENLSQCKDYRSLAELNEEWEDYKPTEPLIENEKIRRELSEWIALYGEHEKIKYFRYNDFVVFRLCREKGTPEPEISLPIEYECDSLREGKEYTKPELCGDEEDGA